MCLKFLNWQAYKNDVFFIARAMKYYREFDDASDIGRLPFRKIIAEFDSDTKRKFENCWRFSFELKSQVDYFQKNRSRNWTNISLEPRKSLKDILLMWDA